MKGLRYSREVVDVFKYDDASFRQFRREAMERFTQNGRFLVAEILEVLVAKPRTADEFREYANQRKAGVTACRTILDQLRDPYARDENGNLIETSDGDYERKEPIPVFPIAANGTQAWSGKETEGVAFALAHPDGYRTYVNQRIRLVEGQVQSVRYHIGRLNELPSAIVPQLDLRTDDDGATPTP